MDGALDVVTSFCKAWSTLDIDEMMGYFTPDAVYHNIPIDAVVGRDDIRAAIVSFTTGWDGVEFEIVHALASAMAEHNAATGVLISTSWFGRASEQFARRNRITLVNGAELARLIKEHLNKEVIPGTNPRPADTPLAGLSLSGVR